jgi:hypothetical protein
MGMFDYIAYEAKCRECGVDLKDFQSKDSLCNLGTITPDKVDYFYAYCDTCKTRNTFKVKRRCVVEAIYRADV